MPIEYAAEDILRLVEKAKGEPKSKEGNFTSDMEVTPFVGKAKDPVITAGFKLMHKQTRLVYTVTSVSFDEVNGDVILTASSGNGKVIVIPSHDFKLYQRL